MKKKSLSSLFDVDKKELRKVDGKDFKDKPKVLEQDSISESQMYKCPSSICDGQVEIVTPIVKMKSLVLYECPVCHERKYMAESDE